MTTVSALSTSDLISNTYSNVNQGIADIEARTAEANAAIGVESVETEEDEVEISEEGESLSSGLEASEESESSDDSSELEAALQSALPDLLAKDNTTALLGTLGSGGSSTGSLFDLLS